MQFIAIMTFDAGHAPLAKVHISHYAFILAHIFITDPAAMTGGTGARHGWVGGE